MNGAVAHIWRHPIKSHGREALKSVLLTKGRTMPWDRTWAVLHSAAKTDGSSWAHCANFSRGAKAPALMAIAAKLDEKCGRVTLSHPNRPQLEFHPDTQADIFLEWVALLMPRDRAPSARIARVPGRGMTDTEFASLSLNNLASNRVVSQKMGTDLSPLRWRGNIWFEGLALWEEFEWISKKIRIGTAELFVREPIGRCLATTANPETGKRDANTLQILEANWGHTNFGVYGEVTKSGKIELGDKPEVLS